MAIKASIEDLVHRDDSGHWEYRIPAEQPHWSVEACRTTYARLLEAAIPGFEGWARPGRAAAYGLEKADRPLALEAAREPDGVLGFPRILEALTKHSARILSFEVDLHIEVWLPTDDPDELERAWIKHGNQFRIANTCDDEGLVINLTFDHPGFAPWFRGLDNRRTAEANRSFLRQALTTLDKAYGAANKSFHGLEGIAPLGYDWT